jgi:hypothetical protein
MTKQERATMPRGNAGPVPGHHRTRIGTGTQHSDEFYRQIIEGVFSLGRSELSTWRALPFDEARARLVGEPWAVALGVK